MKSGALFVEYPVASNALYKPPPAPGALIQKFCEVVTAPDAEVEVTAENPRPPIVVCGASTDAANANLSWKFFTTRKPYWRAQVKPTLYCGSITIGSASWRFAMPFLFSAASVHICPPVNDHPFSQET